MRFLRDGLLMTFRQARRVALVVIGFSVLLFGIVLLVLPGPAFLVIPAGLAILSVEFAWARRWLNRIRTTAESAARKIRGQTEPVNSTR